MKRVLIANRGEIAVRVAATIREMGLSPVTVFSEADRGAPHVKVCDAAIEIGPGPGRESYLVIEKILAAAKTLGADAIHPGYGFLSENAEFSDAVTRAGLTFIGPPASSIRAMGSKTAARQAMDKAGVPVVPGTMADVKDEELDEVAKKIGFPIMAKAVAGGGGKGMRLVRTQQELAPALRLARSEAKNAFGDERVYLERFVEQPRHIEIQVMCDTHGNGVYFGERDCSVQRRHQKIIEESPSTAVTPEIRARMGEVAVKGALAVGYVGAGTMEFLLDPKGTFFFLEMNTRLQVEHPVTEAIFGVDLVREQVRIAQGEKLGYTQADIHSRGHAVEARVYAEDPANNFRPSPGTIESFRVPGGVRVDTGVEAGFTVPIFYDPMIAKVIAWGPTREHAIARLRRALSEMIVGGITTNLEFLDLVLGHEAFGRGDVDTGFIEKYLPAHATAFPPELVPVAAIAAALRRHLDAPAATAAAATSDDSEWARAGRVQGLLREGWVR